MPDREPNLSAPAPFTEIAGYKLRELLGAGSFAQTFRAEKDGLYFALKLLHELPMGNDALRFEREISALKLEHPNLATYVESGIAKYGGLDRAYIVMPYFPGRTLRQAIDDPQDQPLSVAEICRIGAAVAGGLEFLHSHNITHQDLNPKNIFLTDDRQVLILDFGLAKFHDRPTITLEGQIVGTPAFLAPEQLRGQADVQSDLYALGATLFYCFTGRPPFEGHPMALMEMIRVEEPEPPTSYFQELDPSLDDLVLALLAKEPVQRPHDAEVVGSWLRAPHSAMAKPLAYQRNSTPLLAVRATMRQASRALLDTAMTGSLPDYSIASLTVPEVLSDLARASGLVPELALVVDTRVEMTATLSMPKTLKARAYAPPEGRPYDHKDLRDPEQSKRVARGDFQEQLVAGASTFRSASFAIQKADDPWIKRNSRLLVDQLKAREAYDAAAPLMATIRCDIDSLVRRDDRIAIANRFSRGTPDGYWVEIYGLSARSKPEVIAAAFDLLLLLQERGVPVIATLPGALVELAWSIGIAGAEVKLGRQGGAQGATNRAPMRSDASPRFEFHSIFDSMPRKETLELLDHGLLPESHCRCASCRLAKSTTARVDGACDHSLSQYLELRDVLSPLDIDQRVERISQRFNEAEALLKEVRRFIKSQRFSSSSVRNLRRTLAVLERDGSLAPIGKLQRSS